jgi:apolipoprotein D and lipocalin family protein
MHTVVCVSTILFLALPLMNGDEMESKPLQVVPEIDLERYAGTWYEIARLPNKFQRECTGNVTATYTLLDDGTVSVVNRCLRKDGKYTEAVGKARRMSDDEPNSKLEVRFAPAWLSFLPFVWAKYWVIDLAGDYSYAVVGEPGREYLWILARSPSMESTIYAGILDRIAQQGYDTSLLVRTQH